MSGSDRGPVLSEGRPVRAGGPAGRVGTAVCALVVAVATLVTAYAVVTAYMIEPDGPWDDQAVTNANVAATVGLAFSTVIALLTWLFVKAGWLRRGWYAIPAALALAAVLRLTLLGP
ncbi:hypothetical protein ACIQNG_13335 [Streptomyces sp. NPDC091377]|uniref:hypothetical protein n=1 Tax=unclassified Streptomyces TaxID=2593676 RepID=UPI0037FFFA56